MKSKFNIIDAVVIIIIISVIAIGCFFYFKMSAKETPAANETAKIQFVIEVKDLTEDAAKSFEQADECSVSFGETVTGSGIIKDVDVIPYKKWVKNTIDGEVVISEVPDRYIANVTIEAEVSKSDTAFTSGSESIAVGKEMPFNSMGVGAEDCYIIDLIEIKWGDLLWL